MPWIHPSTIMTYYQLSFSTPATKPEIREILMAFLNELEYEAFEETETGLIAWIKTELYQSSSLEEMLSKLPEASGEISYVKEKIEDENWNRKWESHYDPVILGDELAVLAPFHKPEGSWKYVIHIEPKMSFGTGHHATTRLMLSYLLTEELEGKTVLDMGSGTGVLAILCELRGGLKVEAIDNDSWAYENLRENIRRNQTKRITAELSDQVPVKEKQYDLILANINRNILLEQIPSYARGLKSKGVLILSGFLLADREILLEKCQANQLIYIEEKEETGWLACRFEKQNT